VLAETHPRNSLPTSEDGGMMREARVVLADRRYIGYTLAFAFGFSVMFAFISASPFVLQTILGLK
jgi:MFS transporter, DHA1 family, multidrug resistance protein